MKRRNYRAAAMAAAFCMAGASATALAGRQELTYAAEDAAFQAVMKMAADPRVDVKTIAFAKMWAGGTEVSDASVFGTVFENGLSAVPASFTFITHQERVGEWTEVDRYFDQMADFPDAFDPATFPKVGVFKIADSFIVGRIVGASDGAKKSTIQVSLRLIRIATGERVWAGTVEGVYDDPGPGLEQVDSNTRLAIERAAEACAKDVAGKLAGYQSLVLPFDGPLAGAVKQVFIVKLSQASSVKLLDMPAGSAEDRMLGRFLRERMGTNRDVEGSVLKRIVAAAGAGEGSGRDKVAVMSGAVGLYQTAEIAVPEPVGGVAPVVVDRATGLEVDPLRVEVAFDAKFRDVNNGFAVVAAGSGKGLVEPVVVESTAFQQLLKWLSSLEHVVWVALGLVVVLIVLWLISKMFRVR